MARYVLLKYSHLSAFDCPSECIINSTHSNPPTIMCLINVKEKDENMTFQNQETRILKTGQSKKNRAKTNDF